MASKVPFDPEAMVAAHRTLPLGSFIRVTNLRNGLSALLRVMDRGPYIKGRILDVSLAAARDLGFDEDGLTDVEITLLPHGI
jgi:rare lipoprotein A